MTEKYKDDALYGDLVAAPDDKIAELVEGSLYLSPRPSLRHTNAASVLGSMLNAAYHRGSGGPGGWWILDEPELHLGGDVLVPDIAGWRRERLPELPDITGIDLCPDWLCEILSPSTERFDRNEKLPRYARAGVQYLWLVHPLTQRLDAYERFEHQWALVESFVGAAIVAAPPFDEVPFELASLWTR